MRKNAHNLLMTIKNNQYVYHMLDIDKDVLSMENEIDSYFDEIINEGYYKSYRKEYIRNNSGRVYKIIYFVGE